MMPMPTQQVTPPHLHPCAPFAVLVGAHVAAACSGLSAHARMPGSCAAFAVLHAPPFAFLRAFCCVAASCGRYLNADAGPTPRKLALMLGGSDDDNHTPLSPSPLPPPPSPLRWS